jgi:hypothetical protein
MTHLYEKIYFILNIHKKKKKKLALICRERRRTRREGKAFESKSQFPSHC